MTDSVAVLRTTKHNLHNITTFIKIKYLVFLVCYLIRKKGRSLKSVLVII